LERAFWVQVRAGLPTAQAAAAVGVSTMSGVRWFAKAGGVCRISREPAGRLLSFADREEIAAGAAAGLSVRAVAARIGRAASTVSRELRRCPPGRYRASTAQAHADRLAARPKPGKLAVNEELRAYVQEQLSGRSRLSPEQIAHQLVAEFPHDERMRISHEAIYQSLYVQGRGALRRELTACLRTGRAVRKPRRRADTRGRRPIPPELMISSRPAEAADRAVPGHWEGDLIIGAGGRSAIGTLVERTTRFVMLLHLPGDHTAETVRDAMIPTIGALPQALRQTLTWDRGSELGKHAQITEATNLAIYFCDPASPWQRGSNENTNGLLRQYFPKGTDLSIHTPADLAEVAAGLNERPRKTLDWATPAQAFTQLLSTDLTSRVATTT
jgi:IS30 family transposase